MNVRKLAQQADYSDIKRIGIPRALLYYRYGPLWTTFFKAIGCTVVLSEATTKETVERGDALSDDEVCLASKIYMGHTESLLDKCDAIFVPSMNNFGHFRSFCVKCQALPDLVRNTFADRGIRIVTCLVEETEEGITMEDAFVALALSFGKDKREARQAYARALDAQKQAQAEVVATQNRVLDELSEKRRTASSKDDQPISILMVAHPYIEDDPFAGEAIVGMLERQGATVLSANAVDRESALRVGDTFNETLPWIINREIVGAIELLYDQLDGIMLVSAFPCGPDSMIGDEIVRRMKDKPIISIMIDAQSGTAGLETRIESFVDILRYQKKGGYTHVA